MKNLRNKLCGKNIAKEIAMGMFFFTLFIILLKFSYWKAANGIGDLDTAILLDVVKNTAYKGLPLSDHVATVVKLFPLLKISIEEYCALNLNALPFTEPQNILRGHATLIVYPMSAISILVGTEWTTSIFSSLTFISIPFFSYLFLRSQKVSIIFCVLFLVLVCSHPAWRISLVGAFYFDRFFMLWGLAYTFMLYKPFIIGLPLKPKEMVYISSFFFCGLLTHERGALLLTLFTMLNMAFYFKTPKINIKFFTFISLFGLLYLYIYSKYQINLDNIEVEEKLFNFSKTLENIRQLGVYKLFYFNFILLFFAVVFEWKGAFIAAVMVLPNFLISIGGAEKDGWGTHYHSQYFPFLVYASAVGFIGFNKSNFNIYLEMHFKKIIFLIKILLLNLLIIATLFQLPYSNDIKWGTRNGFEGIIAWLYDLYIIPDSESGYRYQVNRTSELIKQIPENASVSVSIPFDFWRLVKKNNEISLYPFGIGHSEYLLLSYEEDKKGNIIFGAFRVLSDGLVAQRCNTEKIWAAGYREIFRKDHMMVLKRN
jgi:hypothetical protein